MHVDQHVGGTLSDCVYKGQGGGGGELAKGQVRFKLNREGRRGFMDGVMVCQRLVTKY